MKAGVERQANNFMAIWRVETQRGMRWPEPTTETAKRTLLSFFKTSKKKLANQVHCLQLQDFRGILWRGLLNYRGGCGPLPATPSLILSR